MSKKEETQDATPVIKEAPFDKSQVTPAGFALGQLETEMSGLVPQSVDAAHELLRKFAQAQLSACVMPGIEILVHYARTVTELVEKQQKVLEENQSLDPEVVRNIFVAYLEKAHAHVVNAINGLFDEKTPLSGA